MIYLVSINTIPAWIEIPITASADLVGDSTTIEQIFFENPLIHFSLAKLPWASVILVLIHSKYAGKCEKEQNSD